MSEQEKTGAIGGSSAADEVLRPVVQNFVGKFIDMVLNVKPIDQMLGTLSPSVRAASSLLPMGAAYVMAKMPVTMFKSPAMAHFVQDVVVESARHVDRKIKEKGGVDKVSPQEYEEALNKGLETAAAKKYVVIDGLVHSPRCANISHRLQPQRHNNPNQPPRPPSFPEVTIEEAIEQNLLIATCCLKAAQAELSKPTAPKAEPKKARSPMEVLGGADPELQKQFFAWFKALPVSDHDRVNKLLVHLDSLDELRGLMAADPEIRGDMLSLLENTNASYTVASYLKLIGQAVKIGSVHALGAIKAGWKAYRKFDASLAPAVEKTRAFRDKKRETASFWRNLGRFFWPF